MSRLVNALKCRLNRGEKGATMVEYGIMVALIAVIVMVAVGPLGTAISTMFNNLATAL
jgi:pilus assembly protein Flp/PilA